MALHKVPTRAATYMSSASTCRTLMDMENDLVFTLCAHDSILWRTDSFVCMQAIGAGCTQLGTGKARFPPPKLVKALC